MPFNQWSPEMREALTALAPPAPHPRLSGRGRPEDVNILGTLAHHPALARAFFTLQGHLLRATTLTERQRELVIMRVATLRHSVYEWAQHIFVARKAGLTDLEIAWIAWGPDAPAWSESDASLLRAVDDLDRDGVITDDTWVVLSTHLDVRQMLDLIFTAGSYRMLAWMVASLGVALDDDLRGALKRASTV